jgi:hypothetical protein
MRHAFLTLTAALAMIGGGARAAMTLSSADIAPNAQISAAQIYPRCGGQNISPALAWSGAPAGARSLVLTMIDLDVKPALWSHWIVVDLPPLSKGLARGTRTLPGKAKVVAGNFGDAAYDGPCPPNGTGAHHYQFTIWAMPAVTTAIAPDANASQIAPMLSKTALAHASFSGWVKR